MVPSSAACSAAMFVPALSSASGYSLLPTRGFSGLTGSAKRASSILPAFGDEVSSAPPLAPQAPRSELTAVMTRAVSKELAYEQPMTARQLASMDAAGAALAMARASSWMRSAGTSQIFSAQAGRVLLDLGCKLVEAGGVLLHELVVIQVFLDEHVRHAQQKRDVGARRDGNPVVGEDAAVVETRVHDDHAGAGLGGGGQALHGRGADAVAVAAPDEHDHLRVAEVGGEVGCADGQLVGALLRQVARGRMRVHVGRAERMHEALGVLLARRTRVLDDAERLGAVLRDDVLHALADFSEGGVPVDGLERAVVLAAQRLRHALVGVCHLGQAVAAPADVALRVGVHVAAAKRPQLAVHRGGHQAALAGTAVAQRRSLFRFM